MNILEIGPNTGGHVTNSADIQKALDVVGRDQAYDALYLKEGNYNINDPGFSNPYSILAVNSGSTIYGDIEEETGKPLTKFVLAENVSTKRFSCGLPILGPAEEIGKEIEIAGLFFDGRCGPYAHKQTGFSNATCSGTNGKKGNPAGKGFSNFIGAYTGGFQDCSFHHIKVKDSAGDGFRTNRYTPSENIKLFSWDIEYAGHCGIMLENSSFVDVDDIKVVCRGNGAFRCQQDCSDINVEDVTAYGTTDNYSNGFQVTASRINIEKCNIYNMMGCGIEVAGANDTDVTISDCIISNCGWFAQTQNVGVAGILVNGCNALIENNEIYSCYQNAIAANIYSPDGKSYTKSGFVITSEGNKTIDTRLGNFELTGNGKHIANYLESTHTVTTKNDEFNPSKNVSYRVKFLS